MMKNRDVLFVGLCVWVRVSLWIKVVGTCFSILFIFIFLDGVWWG